MALAAGAGLVDGNVVPDAGNDVLQDAPGRFVNSTSLVTTVATRKRCARLFNSWMCIWSFGRRRSVSAKWARSPKTSLSFRSLARRRRRPCPE
jgi:hypothetical protein